MTSGLLLSPAFIVSIVITLGVAFYTYVYLPRQMRKAYRQSLVTLARAVETKDLGSVGLGERVAQYTVAVAREMRVSRGERTKIEYSTYLQDIGNARVPHSVLNKVEGPTEEDFKIIRSHVTVGSEVVEQVKFLQDISPIIRHHHEAWDGSGYPDQIGGDQIPLGSRIIAVCTAYDAMVHERPYRPAMDEQDAVQEIRRATGTKYDPNVVDAFLKVLKKACGKAIG